MWGGDVVTITLGQGQPFKGQLVSKIRAGRVPMQARFESSTRALGTQVGTLVP